MKEQLINFDTAKLAKEKGFDIDNEYYYIEDLKIQGIFPTQSLLQKWLREKYKIIVFTSPLIPDCIYYGTTIFSKALKIEENFCFYKQYERALEEGLQEALKLI